MMNNRGHLPAGQPMQGGVADMGPGPGPGSGGGRRGGRAHHYPNSAHHFAHHPVNQHMYPPNYIPYGGAAPFYMPPQYQGAAIGAPAYLPYATTGYSRSPPTMQPFVPMVPQTHYPRPPQSPVVSTPYQAPPPPVPIPMPPHTPSSTHSHAVPPPMTPPVTQIQEPPQVTPEPQLKTVEQQPPPAQALHEVLASHVPPVPPPETPPGLATARTEPFRPRLPWYSVPDSPFPSRAPKSKRRRRALGAGVALERPESQPTSSGQTPSNETELPQTPGAAEAPDRAAEPLEDVDQEPAATTPKAASKASVSEVPARSETPSTQDHPSEDAPSTSPTTPSSVQASKSSITASINVAAKPIKPATRSAIPPIPAVPVLPALPKTSPKDPKTPGTTGKVQIEANASVTHDPCPEQTDSQVATTSNVDGTAEEPSLETVQPAAGQAKPKSWANLFTKPATPAGSAGVAVTGAHAQPNGGVTGTAAAGASGVFTQSNVSSIAEALQSYRVGGAGKLAFLEPRGLVNTGNMCYMNSVLQVLISCVPFFEFLDQVSKKTAYSFKSETPLLDAMIMFMREFKVIDSAVSVDQLKRRLKSEELEQYGDAFTPEFVYDAIRKLPRFAAMRGGHQQDAEEFLGFLLEKLHDECAQVIRAAPLSTVSTAPNSSLPSPTSSSRAQDGTDDDWLEVGPRQRAAVTRSSGHSTISSPITRIFGGQLRSELRVQGKRPSATLEPYQPLQLDIGSPEIRNIVDALRGITRPETVDGNFGSPHGADAKATKQVFIESLPPVLILHLKRFQFDAEGRSTVKIWKKIGYPLELEIPPDVISRQQRNTILKDNAGPPRYRLSAVVYHHGKNASGGHYTVDVRRQDGLEWIRIDDTVIRRVRSEDVAEGGAEDDGRKESGNTAATNRFLGINDEDTGDDEGWKQATAGNKKWSSVVNGATATTANGSKAKQHKESMKDNKVAYLLFYQRI